MNVLVRGCRNIAAVLALLGIYACAVPIGKVKAPTGSIPESRASQTGIGSWYGPGFHGQATASGAIYDQNDFTAAHQTLPLGTRVLVTNLNNGKFVEVLVNDRGPFAKGRIIDLSYAAAHAIDMIGPGTAPVRIEVLDAPRPIKAIRASLDYTLQLGSFSKLENAQLLRDRLHGTFSDIAIVPMQSNNGSYYRVQLGTYASRGEAEAKARQLAQRGYSAIITEKE